MIVTNSIRPGALLECDFGNYRTIKDANGNDEFDREHFDGRIPYEIVKLRPVVVLGEHKGQYLVVPVSSTEDTHKVPRKTGVARGFHVPVPPNEIPATHFYLPGTIRWAKVNMMQSVARFRLSSIYCRNTSRYIDTSVSASTLGNIQEAVAIFLNRKDWLVK